MLTRRTVLAAAAGTVAAATLTSARANAGTSTATTVTVPGYSFDVLGELYLPGWLTYRGTKVSGLSGVDFDPATNTLYLLSSDRSDQRPARFYTASVSVTGSDCPKVSLTGSVNTLRRPDGTPYPPSASAGQDLVDPQAIRFNPTNGNVLWANAGARTATQQVDPAVREATTTGSFVRELAKAANEVVGTDGAGPRDGGGFSGLAVNGNNLVTALRSPLLQDGDQPVRLTVADLATGSSHVQWAYQLEALPGNGVAEILTVSATKYLVLERAPVPGGDDSVRLYEINLGSGATNVLRVPSLVGATYKATAKRLLVDFSALGLSSVKDFEGMTWGPTLSDGRRTLVFVSNNHLQSAQPTQVVALGVTLS
jgi:hypothetical protein